MDALNKLKELLLKQSREATKILLQKEYEKLYPDKTFSDDYWEGFMDGVDKTLETKKLEKEGYFDSPLG